MEVNPLGTKRFHHFRLGLQANSMNNLDCNPPLQSEPPQDFRVVAVYVSRRLHHVSVCDSVSVDRGFRAGLARAGRSAPLHGAHKLRPCFPSRPCFPF